MLSLWHFRLAGSRSLSIGGWQPNESGAVFGWRRRFLFDVFRGRRLRRWRGPMGSASPRPDRNSWLRGSPACFLSGIFGWRDRGLYPLAGGSRMNLARSLGGAADFCLTSFEVGGFGAGADLWGSFPTTRSQQLAEGVSGVLSLWHFRLAGSRSLSIGGWQPNESGAVFGWRRRFLFDVFRGRRLRRWRGPMGSASPRPDRNSWLRGSPACFLSGIFGWRDRGLYPLAGGSRMNLARSLGGAADFCLTSFEVGGSGAGADLWVSFPTTRSQQLAEGVSGVLSLWHFRLAGIAVFIHWRVAAE